MIRILNTNVDGTKPTPIALTRIKGIGKRFALLICRKAEIDPRKRFVAVSSISFRFYYHIFLILLFIALQLHLILLPNQKQATDWRCETFDWIKSEIDQWKCAKHKEMNFLNVVLLLSRAILCKDASAQQNQQKKRVKSGLRKLAQWRKTCNWLFDLILFLMKWQWSPFQLCNGRFGLCCGLFLLQFFVAWCCFTFCFFVWCVLVYCVSFLVWHFVLEQMLLFDLFLFEWERIFAVK